MKVVLLTPPFTQLNTPYPATAYLKGYLNTLGVESFQSDLGLEVILEVFSSAGLESVFAMVDESEKKLSDNAYRILTNRKKYLKTIDAVISFLQNKNQTMAHTICAGNYLPRAGRFEQLEDLEWAFGTMGTHDKARHLATLYLEDLGDLITEAIDENFGFSRYAERLARTATHFDDLYEELNDENSLISDVMLQLVEGILEDEEPDVVLISVPFPGNVFGAFKCGQFIKENYPDLPIVLGGGYANTELRRVYDERVFKFVDFITLDDGEAPVRHILEYFESKRAKNELKRTFLLENGMVQYINGSSEFDVPQLEVGTPDYGDLLLDEYLSVIEVVNPMHRLWSDGRWNKLTLAHGCYWGKCSFCDVSLDYIKRYEPVTAAVICDRIETIVEQTGQNGFHFVDEAAPPALMRDVALEILRRDLTVVWWTNIRFEKSFTRDLCSLLRASGCIAVSGGLEVASDRLLDKMKKGVSVAQVARVADAFSESGIMVHAYLMYGFPTQTAQETIDSMEMVRQMVAAGVIQSGFWHQFAMTAHSPVGLEPEAFGVSRVGPDFGGFADNDLFHEDAAGVRHENFSEGLRISIFNYMQGMGLEEDVRSWFDFEVPATTVEPGYIEKCLMEEADRKPKDSDQMIWIGGEFGEPRLVGGKGKEGFWELEVTGLEENFVLNLERKWGEAIYKILCGAKAQVANLRQQSGSNERQNDQEEAQVTNLRQHELTNTLQQGESGQKFSVGMARQLWAEKEMGDFEDFLGSEVYRALREKGLLII